MHYVVGLHDRRGQHGRVLGRTCLYAPCRSIAWQTMSARLHIGSDVSICTMLLGCMIDEVSTVECWVRRVYMHHVGRLYDRRGQHRWVLGRTCLYAPWLWVAWHIRLTRLSVGSNVSLCTTLVCCMTDEVSMVGCWVGRVYMHHVVGLHDRRGQYDCVLGQICLYAPQRLGGMIDKVNTVACWIRCVYMHQSRNMICWETG